MPEQSRKKSHGVVYTPSYLVTTILDLTGYRGAVIRGKHVMENSCGEGAFLREAVGRYCAVCASQSASTSEIKRELETYVHGLEIDPETLGRCVASLNQVAKEYGVVGVEWDVRLGDATTSSRFDRQMDFVVGNPPYVRIHNLARSSNLKKEFELFQEGMSDLYIAFFEVGLKMLNETGALGYITPSSYFSSVAGARLRAYLVKERLLKTVVDLKHYQAFDDASTYAAITVLQKGRTRDVAAFYEFDEAEKAPRYVCDLKARDYCLDGKFFFANETNLNSLREILSADAKSDVRVKNGFATLCDPVFAASEFPFQSKYIVPVVKASKGLVRQIIFPYDENARPISEEDLRRETELYAYLVARRDRLLARNIEKPGDENWFLYGRNQGIADVYKDKLALNVLVRTAADLKILPAPPGVGVYGGLYITSPTVPLTAVRDLLLADEFSAYVKLLAKYKRGGYYTFSSKDVQNYLDYRLS